MYVIKYVCMYVYVYVYVFVYVYIYAYIYISAYLYRYTYVGVNSEPVLDIGMKWTQLCTPTAGSSSKVPRVSVSVPFRFLGSNKRPTTTWDQGIGIWYYNVLYKYSSTFDTHIYICTHYLTYYYLLYRLYIMPCRSSHLVPNGVIVDNSNLPNNQPKWQNHQTSG